MLPFLSSHSSSPGVELRTRSVCRLGFVCVPVASLPWQEEQFWRKSFAPAAIAPAWLSYGFSRMRSFSGTFIFHAPSPTEAASSTLAENRSEEHTSELQSHSFISYAVFCFKK